MRPLPLPPSGWLCLARDEFGAGMSSFQAYAPLRTSTLEQLWPLGRVPVIWIRFTRRLVADAGSILRHIAGLSVHLHGALALIFEDMIRSRSSLLRSMPCTRPS